MYARQMLSGRRCLPVVRVVYTWNPPRFTYSKLGINTPLQTDAALMNWQFHSLQVLERSYKIKKFPKVSCSIIHSPPLKFPFIFIQPQPSLFLLSTDPITIALALLISHDVKGGWVFW